MANQAHSLRSELGDDPHADSIAQAATCAAPLLAAAGPDSSAAIDWLRPQLAPWERLALQRAQLHIPYSALRTPHFFDSFLHYYSKNNRKHRGVFFTPQPIANYIVAQIDRLLREQCGFTAGLADDRITLIDPACGTGVFLLALIDFLHSKHGHSDHLDSLVPRLTGIEILPPASFLTKLNIALKLAEAGNDFSNTNHINIITGDALSPNLQSAIDYLHSTFPVLLGNPPFSSLSTNTNPWIARLIRGDDEIRGYIRANGEQLGERKTWLHDVYVKFIRLAQWQVEQAGCGIVGFITNHGYLDNATFRLMRHELLRVFPHIEILDLHGNRKKHEVAPTGETDENVFGLDQGVAIGLFCRPSTPTRRASEDITFSVIEYSELWGSRESKLASLADHSLTRHASLLNPKSPKWLFVPAATSAVHPEYVSSWSLADAMPVNTTAPVTARDHFVVAFTRDELIARLTEFRDSSIPDDVIRERYFQRTRSARYETGDTRGWKLATARRTVADDPNWQRHIIRCLYRPFDWRFVFWHPAMIDWPRTEVTQHLVDNLCLIARRQQLPTQPCTFFWISDCLALDGVIRSDNRGSESLFPLYVAGEANFAQGFIEQFVGATNLGWKMIGKSDLVTTFGPEDLLAYIYALFHSLRYRERYAAELRGDFPRVLMPNSTEQFRRLSHFGSELIRLHLLQASEPVPSTEYSVLSTSSERSIVDDQKKASQSFRAGGYSALRKWLQPKHRSMNDAEYARIVSVIERTMEIMKQIDA
jgi:predicted helicase